MRTKSSTARTGFTLVELLVVITIIGLMSGMFLVAFQGAAMESRVVKTRSTIQKISDVLTARMEEYVAYPIALRTPVGSLVPSAVDSGSLDETVMTLRERARLLLLRDIIRMEMPDHPDDLKYTTFWQTQIGSNLATYLSSNLPRTIATGLISKTNGAQFYAKNALPGRARSLMSALTVNGAPRPNWDETNANAELLYLIVADSELEGSSAIELFGAAEIADKDGDGLNEFIDAFGQPIRWIRWPAWYSNATRYYPDMLDPALIDQASGRLLINMETIDRLGSDPGWTKSGAEPGNGMAPLVVSSGRDRGFGIRFRDIDRYTPAPSAPPPVGLFPTSPSSGSVSSYSSAETPWNSQFPSYGNSSTFTDPWFPRGANGGSARLRMGELLSPADPPETDVGTIPSGFDVANPNHARDNITNYDGTGISL